MESEGQQVPEGLDPMVAELWASNQNRMNVLGHQGVQVDQITIISALVDSIVGMLTENDPDSFNEIQRRFHERIASLLDDIERQVERARLMAPGPQMNGGLFIPPS